MAENVTFYIVRHFQTRRKVTNTKHKQSFRGYSRISRDKCVIFCALLQKVTSYETGNLYNLAGRLAVNIDKIMRT